MIFILKSFISCGEITFYIEIVYGRRNLKTLKFIFVYYTLFHS